MASLGPSATQSQAIGDTQHLATLRMARLVRTRREGTQVFYRLENEHVARLVRDAVYNAEHAGPEVPPHHVDEGVSPLASVATTRSRVQGPRSRTSQRAEQTRPGHPDNHMAVKEDADD